MVTGWLIKVVVVLGCFAALAYDGLSIGAARMSSTDAADAAARSASEAWSTTKDTQKAYDAAVAELVEQNASGTIETTSFTVDPDGTVHLVLDRTARTVLVRRLSPISDWATIHETGTGRYVT